MFMVEEYSPLPTLRATTQKQPLFHTLPAFIYFIVGLHRPKYDV